MSYFVVNTFASRATHIMKSSGPWVPGLANQIITGAIKSTLCGLTAARYVNVFGPGEASCRECRRRWELDVAQETVKSPEQRQREESNLAVVRALILVVLVVATIYLVTRH